MRITTRLMLAAGTVAAALVVSAVPAQATGTFTPPVLLSVGHVDAVDVEFEDGELELGVHDDTVEPGVHRDHDDVIFVVKRQAKTTVPSDPAFGFLGAAGAPVWILPEIENPDLLWAGIATEEIAAGVFQDDTVNLRVQKVIGSGQLALYTENAVGLPNVLADSGDGLPDTIALTAGDHLHLNWAFDRAGVYQVTVKATATLADTGTSVSSDPAHLRFVVLP